MHRQDPDRLLMQSSPLPPNDVREGELPIFTSGPKTGTEGEDTNTDNIEDITGIATETEGGDNKE